MTTSKDFVRQASLFTMGGLTDPRLMPGYKPTPGVSFFKILRKSFEGIVGKKINNEVVQG